MLDRRLEQEFSYEQKYAILPFKDFEAEEKEMSGKLRIRRGKKKSKLAAAWI